MVSDRQLKANRQNSVLGGVKTDSGKAVSKYNAEKHGILREAITDYEKGAYAQILLEIEQQFSPESFVERILIERLAISYIKLYRLQKAETEFMKTQLEPTLTEVHGGLDDLFKEEVVVVKQGYTPILPGVAIESLVNIYGRYEATLENRLYRSLHELERFLEAKRHGSGDALGETGAINNEMGSFGEGKLS